MRPALKFCWLFTLSISLWSVDASAQESVDDSAEPSAAEENLATAETEPSNPPSVPTTLTPAGFWRNQETVQPAAPDVYLLPDESGKLRKVLGFRYEDFLNAWKRNESATTVSPPPYVLRALDISGSVLETHARLRVEVEITVQAEGWIDIPVQLPEFIVQQLEIEDQVNGECLIFDKQRYGHVVWLSGQAGQQRKLVLEGLAKLKLSPGSHGIELYLPRATTAQFSLRVPKSSTRFESSPGLTLTTVALEEGMTEIRVLGQANPLRLNWAPAEKQASNQKVLVEVEGQTKVSLDRRRVLYEATLQINSFERPLEQIRVRLPHKTKLKLGETQGEYEIKEIGVASGEDQGPVVEIRPLQPRIKPWSLSLSAERPIETFSDSTECDVEGFEVLEADRQSGTLTLEVDDQLQAYFDTHDDIEQTSLQESVAATEGRSLLGQFRYTRFPWHLVVHTSPRQRRVSVKPEYELTLNPEEARLDVSYDYQLTGAQIFSLRINLQGWKLMEAPIESGGLIDANRIFETRDGLVLPLVDPETQQLPLNFSLRKDIQLGDNTFFLPEPLRAFVVDGELLVNFPEALQVTPKLGEMAGLGVLAKAEKDANGSADQESIDLDEQIRLRTFLARPKFVAEVRQRQRQVTATEQTQVQVDQQVIRVRQRIDYQAKYGPVSQLSLNLPEQLWSNDSLTVTLDGEPLPFGLGTAVAEEPPVTSRDEYANEDATLRPIIVSLPRSMQNDIPIEIAYELPTPTLAAEELTPLLLPLALPSDPLSKHGAVVSASQPVIVALNQRSSADEWEVITEESSATNGVSELRLLSLENPLFLPLLAEIESADQVQLATLERAWIQSWLATGQRQERAVFRFRTAFAKVFVQLPLGFDSTEIEVLLDGDPWAFELLADNRLAVNLPTKEQRNSRTLELRYQTTASLPSWGKLQSLMPRLECRLASAPIYWQLILPRGWQVATPPDQLIPDYWLGWKNYRWGRQPTLSQADLEQITGAVSSAEPTPLSAQYVYRTFELPAEIEVVVIRQAWLLLACALGAFGIGLLWLYTPLARNGVFWFGLALALLVGIFSYPEVTLLAIQVILAGGLMTFATGVLRHVFQEGLSSPFSTSSYQLEPPAEITESWQRKKPSGTIPSSETTATMRTGRPLS